MGRPSREGPKQRSLTPSEFKGAPSGLEPVALPRVNTCELACRAAVTALWFVSLCYASLTQGNDVAVSCHLLLIPITVAAGVCE